MPARRSLLNLRSAVYARTGNRDKTQVSLGRPRIADLTFTCGMRIGLWVRVGSSCPSVTQWLVYQRQTPVPQVRPAPKPQSKTWSPRFRRPSFAASSSTNGIEAADVLPNRVRLFSAFSGGTPS